MSTGYFSTITVRTTTRRQAAASMQKKKSLPGRMDGGSLFLNSPLLVLFFLKYIKYDFLVQWHESRESRIRLCLTLPQKFHNVYIHASYLCTFSSDFISCLILWLHTLFQIAQKFVNRDESFVKNWKSLLIGVPVLWNQDYERSTANSLRTFLYFKSRYIFKYTLIEKFPSQCLSFINIHYT